jgi:hypothetical protein
MLARWHQQARNALRGPSVKFSRELKLGLQTAGAQLQLSDVAASAVINVEKDQFEQRVLSVSARNTPTEYEITYAVSFSVQREQKEILSSQTLSLSRNYSFDETALLAKEREQEILRAALAKDLASHDHSTAHAVGDAHEHQVARAYLGARHRGAVVRLHGVPDGGSGLPPVP